MRIYADIGRFPNAGPEPSLVIVQVAPTPPPGFQPIPSNGKFYLDVPEGVQPPPIDSTSRLLGPVPANIVPSIFNGLLRGFPGFRFVRYNAFLTSTDVDALDLTATFPVNPGPPPVKYATRVQVGRGGGINQGIAPNSVAILAQNPTTTPVRPGVLITNTIDISGDIPAGTTRFAVYWKIHEYAVTADVMAYDGPNVGANDAALKGLLEVDQSPTDLEVYLSTNDGGGYSRVERLVPISTCDTGTLIRLAFVNKAVSKRYLASYAVIY
jgi:hypothetical protein